MENKKKTEIIELKNSLLFDGEVIFHSQIAAAPAMLEALELLFELSGYHDGFNCMCSDNSCDTCIANVKMAEAIKKAKGSYECSIQLKANTENN